MSYCEGCGRPVPDGRRYCSDCEGAGKKPAPGKKGRPAVILMAVLVVLFAAFFVLALLFGGKEKAASPAGEALVAWEGAGETGDIGPGPEELVIDAPYAQSVLDHPRPEEPAGGHRYEIVVADINWQEAYDQAQAAGGHLATITSQEEYQEICLMADQLVQQVELRYLWLGARVGSDGWGDDSWITGESWTFDIWYPGEPSGADSDGTPEDVLCMWRVGDGGWTFNDQRTDLVSQYTAGKIGYVIEYEG